MSAADAPIGVFDSGVGGLSVLAAIRALLPAERLIYVADSAFVPYGGRPETLIRERALLLSGFLAEQGAKAVVVACNTATAAAVQLLRECFAIPIVAMEPALKPAVAATRSGVVGVLATSGTLGSRRFAELAERYGRNVQVVTQPCAGLVEQVERGDLDGPQTRALVTRYLEPLVSAGADTLILGCTHYPFLRPVIQELAGESVTLIETGQAVAAQVRRVLEARELLRSGGNGDEAFWSSGSVAAAQPVVEALWSRPVRVRPLPQTGAPAPLY